MPFDSAKRKSVIVRATALTLLIASVTYGAAQSPSADNHPHFAVASVRLSPPDAPFTSFSRAGAITFTATGAPLMGLLATAYGVSPSQILGLPNWGAATRYDVAAKPDGEKPLEKKQFEQALQQLLRDRLHLAFHRERKMTEGYRLVVAKDGPKLKPSHGGFPGRTEIDRDGTYAYNITLQDFAAGLDSFVGDYPVVDQTGIKGNFQIILKFAVHENEDSPLPSVFTAVQEQLGLKLERAKVPLDMIVIDHIDREPTEN